MPTRKELNLAIFERTADKVLWQPRLETWIDHHRQRDTLPAHLKGKTRFEIYDELCCSVRYGAAGTARELSGRLETTTEKTADHTIETYHTPLGDLRRVYKDIYEDGRLVNHRIEEFPVKTADDLKALTWIMDQTRYSVDVEDFKKKVDALGERAQPVGWLTSAGYTELIKQWAGLPQTCYFLADAPAELEAYLEACERRDDRVLDAVLKLPVRLFELGDHATNEFTPPPVLEKYMIPRWRKLSARIHERGGYVWSHWDGNSRLILPYLKDTGLDAVEALTPAPMCDMTLEMIKEAVGETIVCLDLLPVIDFLPNHPTGKLLDFTKRVIEMFAPRLILGISDELSAVGQIEKVQAVCELVDRICGLAD